MTWTEEQCRDLYLDRSSLTYSSARFRKSLVVRRTLTIATGKTELTIFHRLDTSSANIKVKDIVVNSSSTLKVLGILFDNCIQWDKQVKKVTKETRRSLQGLKIIIKTFHPTTNFNPSYFTLFVKIILWQSSVAIANTQRVTL